MAYRDLEDIRDSNSGWDYTELFESKRSIVGIPTSNSRS